MKTRTLLIISVCLNAGLVAAYFAVNRPPENAAAPVQETVVSVEKTGPGQKRTILATTTMVTNGLNWASVEADDYKRYIANLRAIGCPEETIRDIIIADVNKLYGAKLAALRTPASEFKFWQADNRDIRAAARERQIKVRELDQEKKALIKELLGVDLDQEMAKWTGRENADDWRFAFLSLDKQEQLRSLRDKYRDMQQELFAQGGGPENRTKIQAMLAQQEADVAKLLTPAELEEYQLRNSFTAQNMRNNLGTFQPDEKEFREIFDARKTFDDQYGFGRAGGNDVTPDQRRAAQQQLDDQIKAMLGDDRYKDYSLAQDARYRDIYNFAQENNLPTATAQKVYDIRKAAEDEQNKVRTDPSIPAEQRQILLTALASQTSQALGAVLGPDLASTYQSNNGRWVNQLTRTDNNQRGFGGLGGFGGGGNGGNPGRRGRPPQ